MGTCTHLVVHAVSAMPGVAVEVEVEELAAVHLRSELRTPPEPLGRWPLGGGVLTDHGTGQGDSAAPGTCTLHESVSTRR